MSARPGPSPAEGPGQRSRYVGIQEFGNRHVGGPGSGKTTIALLKARRTVLERLRPEQSVLFLRFSNSAIRRILESSGSILTTAIGRHLEIKTCHSFAWDILRSHGYLLSLQRILTIIAAQDAAVIRAGLTDEAWTAEEEASLSRTGV